MWMNKADWLQERTVTEEGKISVGRYKTTGKYGTRRWTVAEETEAVIP